MALNGANEVAVRAYLEDQLPFQEIPRVIAEVLEQHPPAAHPALEEVLRVDAWSRATAQEMIAAWSTL